MSKKAILAGGNGFIGSAVARQLVADGWEVALLTRGPGPAVDPAAGARSVIWDAAGAGPWEQEVEHADVVVNFAGRSVNSAPTPANRREILESRLAAVRALGAALARAGNRPAAWVQCSAVGYYGPRGDEPCGEDSPPGNDFFAEVCREWELTFAAACPPRVRPVALRLGVVLGRAGGAFPRLLRLARAGFGGAAGRGRQGMSWIHLDDAVDLIVRAATDETLRGPYNACAPQPVANAEFMRMLRGAVRRPWSPPVPAFAVRLGARFVMRTDPDLILHGQFAVPVRLLAAGHRFRHPQLEGALRDLLAPT